MNTSLPETFRCSNAEHVSPCGRVFLARAKENVSMSEVECKPVKWAGPNEMWRDEAELGVSPHAQFCCTR